MKKWIHASETINAWNVSEPSAVEYGKALSEGHKRMNERYAPFAISSNVHFYSGLANSTGYRISLTIPRRAYYEWIAHDKSAGSFNSAVYALYGPANSNINSYSQMVKYNKLGEFKSIDAVMSFLFEKYDNLLEQLEDDDDEYDEDEFEVDINSPVPAEHVPGGQGEPNEVMCPTCNSIFKKAPRCPECGQLLDYTNWR